MPADAKRVRDLFLAAAELPTADRVAYLTQHCSDEAELRAAVERLLAAHDQPASVLNRSAPGMPTAVYTPISEQPGIIVGPYKLMEQIGEGGMGLVFVAEQQHPVRRRVALKIIKPGMDSLQVIARFEAERQALAMMDHQNIAKVLDAGTTESGRPYFVMELVHGVPITAYCDANQLTPRQRLELFVPVCLAIQHAHQKGIIHRDIKPSNVLVTMYDDKPVPKIIDFGVAKAIEQRLTEKTIYTQFGTLVGTFEYMSPEQAEMNAFGVDTRSDIYSLGVLLYELLTGTTPLERPRLRDAAFGEIVRLIKEEDPPRPSVRLSTSGALAKVAAARKTDPAKLSRLVRGELDWVVMKCLEKQRTRRYDSAGGLARDVERYLKDEPIEARPPSALYRFQKFARRHKVVLGAVGVVAAALVLGTAVSIWQAARALAAERQARSNEEAAREQKRRADDARHEAENRGNELAVVNERLRRSKYIADMNLAQHAWEANNLIRTRQLLEMHRPGRGESDLRSFEWHYLHRFFHCDLWTVKAHEGNVTNVVYFSDGKRLISCGRTLAPEGMNVPLDRPGEVKLWDAATGRQLPLTLNGLSDQVGRIALSPDGTLLSAAFRRQGVRIWNLVTGELIALEGHAGEFVRDTCICPDGKRLAALSRRTHETADSRDGVIRIWDLDRQTVIASIDRVGIPLQAPAFSPDGKHLAVANIITSVVKVFDAATGREAFSCEHKDGQFAQAVFSPDGKRLAACGGQGIHFWDVETHDELTAWQTAASLGMCLTYSLDGKRLAMGSIEGLVELWDAGTGQKLDTFKGHAGEVHMIAFSPDGTRLTSAGADGTIRLWDATGQRNASPIAKSEAGSGVSDLSPDGQTIFAAIDEQHYQALDVATGATRSDPIECPTGLVCHDWSADGKRLISTSGGKNIEIIDLGADKPARTFQRDTELPSITAFSPDGKWFAHSDEAGTVKVRNAESGAESRVIKGLEELVHNLAFSPDGARLAGADVNGWVKIWELSTGHETMTAQFKEIYMMRLRFSPDGKLLAVVGNRTHLRNAEARIVNTETGREVQQLKGHTLNVADLAFSPDGQRMATASADRTVRIWDLPSGQEILTLNGHTGGVCSIRFLSDGHRLVSAGWDRTVRVWDATPLPE